jgi:hypothetical protein
LGYPKREIDKASTRNDIHFFLLWRLSIRRVNDLFILTVIIFLFYSVGLYPLVGDVKAEDSFQKVNHILDFTDYDHGSVEDWMRDKGFKFERDARDRKKLDLNVGEEGLILEAKRPVFGIIINEGVDLEKFTSIRLEWGILKYPEGATYEQGIRNEALMVIVFFGYDKISSGHFLIPNSPYFIGFFLGREEMLGKEYVGKYFQKSGRYVCLGNPKPGETVVSQYDLVSAFKRNFKKDEVPLISGVALAIDTTKAGDGGKAAAFIKSIEFLE